MELLRRIPADDTDRMLQIPSVSAIPQVQALRAQIVTAEAELAATQKRYCPMHPKFIQAVTQINQLKEALKDTLRNAGTILSTQYQAATDTEKKLNEALEEQEQTALELNKIAIPYNVLPARSRIRSRHVRCREYSLEGDQCLHGNREESVPHCGGTVGR